MYGGIYFVCRSPADMLLGCDRLSDPNEGVTEHEEEEGVVTEAAVAGDATGGMDL